jgi:hypothetical protein
MVDIKKADRVSGRLRGALAGVWPFRLSVIIRGFLGVCKSVGVNFAPAPLTAGTTYAVGVSR